MSFENKGSMTAAVVVTAAPDRSGNFVIEAGDDPAVVIETAWRNACAERRWANVDPYNPN